MPISLRFRLALLATVVLTQACTPIYYSPNTQLVPLLSGKGDHTVAITGNDTRAELNGAYAFGNRFALGVNAGHFRQKDTENGDGGSGNFGELAVGYFQNFSSHFVFETFGVLGTGDVENHFASSIAGNPGTDGKISGNLMRFGVQPAVGYRQKFFEAAVSTRIASLNYSNVKGSLVFSGTPQVGYLNDNNHLWLFEPALTLRGGLPYLKLQVQIGGSVNLSNSDFRQDKTVGTIGIVYRPKR